MSSASSLNARGCYFLLLLKLLLKLHLVSDFAKNSFHGISASHPNGWKIEGQDSLSCNDCHITTKRATKEDQRPTSCATVTHTWPIRLQHTHTHTNSHTHTHTRRDRKDVTAILCKWVPFARFVAREMERQ